MLGETTDTLGLSPGRENRPASAGETERPRAGAGCPQRRIARLANGTARRTVAPAEWKPGPSEGTVMCPRTFPL